VLYHVQILFLSFDQKVLLLFLGSFF